MHEATRRLLGVLLRQLDGFKEQSKTVVIGATNRKQDLDPALLSRFDSSIAFGLPSDGCRCVFIGTAPTGSCQSRRLQPAWGGRTTLRCLLLTASAARDSDCQAVACSLSFCSVRH